MSHAQNLAGKASENVGVECLTRESGLEAKGQKQQVLHLERDCPTAAASTAAQAAVAAADAIAAAAVVRLEEPPVTSVLAVESAAVLAAAAAVAHQQQPVASVALPGLLAAAV